MSDAAPQPAINPTGAAAIAAPARAQKRAGSTLFGQIAFVFLCAFFLQGLHQTLPGMVAREDGSEQYGLRSRSLPMGDSPYHIRVAYLYRTGEMAEAKNHFHWMRASVWTEHFVDKEFLYHLYLVPFTLGAHDVSDSGALIWGAKLANCVLFGLLAVTLYGVLRGFGVRRPWLFTALIVVLGGIAFCSRTEETRAWPLYVICSLSAWLLMAKNRRIELGLVACVFTLSYAAVHFLVLLWMLRAAVNLMLGAQPGSTRGQEFKAALKQLGAIAVGILAGVLLHPGRADFVQTWLVQYVGVVVGILRGPLQDFGLAILEHLGAVAYSRADAQRLELGNEFLPLAGTDLLIAGGAAILCPTVLALVSAWHRHKPSREAVLALAVALLTLFMFLNSRRFAEVMGPFMALACGIWIEDWLRSRVVAKRFAASPALFGRLSIAAHAFVLVAALGLWAWLITAKEPRMPRPWRDAAVWMRDNPQLKGKMVFHAQWDIFPDLFFYAPQSDYTVGMDPYYMLAHDAKKSNLCRDIIEGRVDESTLERVKQTFNPDYLLVLPNLTPAFAERCHQAEERGKLKLVFSDPENGVVILEVVK